MSSYIEYIQHLREIRPQNDNSQAAYLAALTTVQREVSETLTNKASHAKSDSDIMETGIVEFVRKSQRCRYKQIIDHIRFTYSKSARLAGVEVDRLLDAGKLKKCYDFYFPEESCVSPDQLFNPIFDFLKEHPRAVMTSLLALISNEYHISDHEGKQLLKQLCDDGIIKRNYDGEFKLL